MSAPTAYVAGSVPYQAVPAYYASPNVPVYGQSAASSFSGAVKNTVDGATQAINSAGQQVAAATAPGAKHSGMWNFGILLVILTLVFMLLFWILRIPIVLQTGPGGILLTNQVSFWKTLLAGFVSALVVIFIIWGVSKLTGSK